MNNVWLPLAGPGHDNPKGCLVVGWNTPSYKGVDPTYKGWLGLRLDNAIVVDCDSVEAKDAWIDHIDPTAVTEVRKTPHGYHFFYQRPVEHYTIAPRKLTAIHPKLELKTGMGHQVVYRAPGYRTLTTCARAKIDPAWLPEKTAANYEGAEWSEMPDGIGDDCMISLAGSMRRWGMDEMTILKLLHEVNEITMTRDPMPSHALRRLARQAAKYSPAEVKTWVCPNCEHEVETR